MKKKWVEPKILVQQFVANEYVAACGDSGVVYKFVCDARGGELYYYPTKDNKVDGTYTGSGSAVKLTGGLLSWYSPCSKTHEVDGTNDFYDGFVDYNYNRRQDPGEGVIVWCEFKKGKVDDAHATTNLDMSSWETAKS